MKDEDSFNHCTLFTRTDVYSLWPERLSQFHPSATAAEPACDPVLRRHQCVTFCSVLLRGATDWRVALALRLFRAARAYAACGGTFLHPLRFSDALACGGW